MILMPTVYHETGRFLRALADNAWFQTNTGKDGKQRHGPGPPAVCGALMEAGQDLLVFPGGAAEANKRWRKIFAGMARAYRFRSNGRSTRLQHHPFGMVGPDDWWDHAIEGHELLHSRPVKLLQKLGLLGEIRKISSRRCPWTVQYLTAQAGALLPRLRRTDQVPDCRGKMSRSPSRNPCATKQPSVSKTWWPTCCCCGHRTNTRKAHAPAPADSMTPGIRT